MFRKFLNPDNALMITMTQITDCIFLSMFWLLGCIPVVTLGASFAALYDATYRGFRRGDKHCWGRFLQVYRDNWKVGILPTVVFLAAAVALTKVLVGLWNTAVMGNLPWMVFSLRLLWMENLQVTQECSAFWMRDRSATWQFVPLFAVWAWEKP